MSDVDDRILERLERAGADFRNQPVPPVEVRWPVGRRRGWAAPLAIAASVALIVAGVAVVASIGNDRTSPPATPVQLQPDREYAVGAPYVGASGPAAPPPKPCSEALATATATTRASVEGVAGLITLNAKTGCGLVPDPSSLGLVNAQQRPLGVPLSKGNTTNPTYLRSEFAEAAGHVRVGFAWSGSYCGPPAKWIALTVNGDNAVLVALDGPAPACHPGGTSVLIPGSVGAPDDAVVPPPLSWKALTESVVLPTTVAAGPIPLVVVLSNHGKTAVSLASPCPQVVARTEVGGASVGGPLQDLCSRPLTVEPGKELTLALGALDFPTASTFPQLNVASGEPVTVTFSIAGIPPATATTHIR